MHTLIFLEEASKELSKAAQWYEEKSEGLGNRFIDTIQKKVQLIQQFPERYPKRKIISEKPYYALSPISLFTLFTNRKRKLWSMLFSMQKEIHGEKIKKVVREPFSLLKPIRRRQQIINAFLQSPPDPYP